MAQSVRNSSDKSDYLIAVVINVLKLTTVYSGSVVVCSGSVVVTAYDFESGLPGSNPEWGQIYYKASILHRAYPSLHPFGVVHWVPEQLNIKAVTETCKLIDVCSLELCFATPSMVSSGICHGNEVNSTA